MVFFLIFLILQWHFLESDVSRARKAREFVSDHGEAVCARDVC